jgi:ketosteroid isomerase-like protein
MSSEAVARIVAAYEALNRRDCDATVAVLAEDVVWRESPELPDAGEIRGRTAVREFLDRYLDSWDEFEQRVEDTSVAGERVAIFLHMTGIGHGSGVQVNTRYAHVWTVRDGEGIRIDAYRDPDDARRALERPASEP